MKYRLRNVTRGTVLGEAIDIADTSAKRTTGLLKHTELRAGEGLWIVPCEGVHTFFMKFALDLVYIDKKNVVRKVVGNVRPWRASFCLMAHGVVELPVGTIEGSGTRKRDELVFEEMPL
ncbi:MAG TPA: DUF192 domain-containing protein [Bryobacteraceae bacterium]|nr:DUF192 domain-containing protein [Bryobacteraceae bacterium]